MYTKCNKKHIIKAKMLSKIYQCTDKNTIYRKNAQKNIGSSQIC